MWTNLASGRRLSDPFRPGGGWKHWCRRRCTSGSFWKSHPKFNVLVVIQPLPPFLFLCPPLPLIVQQLQNQQSLTFPIWTAGSLMAMVVVFNVLSHRVTKNGTRLLDALPMWSNFPPSGFYSRLVIKCILSVLCLALESCRDRLLNLDFKSAAPSTCFHGGPDYVKTSWSGRSVRAAFIMKSR